MIKVSSDYFNLHKIADSGQCFRITPCSQGGYITISEDKFVRATICEDTSWNFDCTQAEFDEYWKHYFDLGQDYSKWFGSIDKNDVYLTNAAYAGLGLRVLNQNPWETLVSFIVSQRRSVASITSCISRICKKFGEKIDTDLDDIYTFPTPEKLANATNEELASCGLGYRTEYVLNAAQKIASNQINLEELTKVDDQTLIECLMQLKGVGIKVANCTALYGFHRLGLFPIDVWIKRVLDAHYPQGFPLDKYDGYSGFLQLLMFYEARH